MKRILSLILVAVLCIGVLTGCQVVDKVKDLIGLGQPDVTVDGPTVDDAVSMLHSIMKEKNTKPTKDYDLVAQVVVAKGDVKATFTVEWTCDDETIVIRESTKKGFVTVDLPDANDVAFDYTLTATVSDAEGNKASKSYTFTLPNVNNSGIVTELEEGVAYKIFLLQGNMGLRYYALNTDEQDHKFIQTTTDPKAGVEFFAEKDGDGYRIYTLIDGVKNYIYVNVTKSDDGKYSKFIGFSSENSSVLTYKESMGGTWTATVFDIVWGIGTYNSYTTISVSEGTYFTEDKVGSSQFVIQFVTAEYANSLEEDKLPDATDDAKAVLDQLYALADGESATGNFQLTGKITALDSYNNPTIVVEGYENMPVYCYRLTVEAKVGDIITVSATQMKNYQGTYEFMNCTLVENTDTPSGELGIVTNPEIGKAYKFGLYHGNEKATVYFNGQNYNSYAWYFAYSKNLSDAVDVYLEAVEGVADGYRLYFMNGDAKTYVVAFPRDGDTTKGTLKFDTVCPSEYFTFNTEYNTLVYTSVTGEQFYLGSSGTYTSISCSAISYISSSTSYPAHLYAEGATGGNGGTDDPVTPPVGGGDDVKPADGAPVAGQAYDLYMVLPTGTVYFSGALDAEKGTYLATTADAAASVKVYFEVVSGGYNIYFMSGDVKTYINAEAYLKSNGYAGCHFVLGTTATTVWTYDVELGILEVYGEVEGKSDTFFAGTYGTYNTVSLSGAYYKDQIASGTQFPARISPVEAETTAKDILDALYALADGETVEGSFTLTGKITALDNKNYPTFVVEGYENMPVYCYKLVVEAQVGDIITVTAKTLKNYKGTYEFMDCTLAHDCVYAEATCTTVELCTICGAEKPGSTTLPHTWVDATCTVPKTCSVCGGTEGATAAHSFVDGVCSCGITESEKKVTVNFGDYAAANGWESGKMQNTVIANGDITITAGSNNPAVSYGNNTGKYYSSDFTWRIYQADAPFVTITGIEGVSIKHIEIMYTAKNEGTLAIGETFVASYEVVAVNANSVTLTVVNNGGGNYTNGQALITAIVVYYEGGNEAGEQQPETPVVPDDGTMTIPEVLASAEGDAVKVKGTVCDIYYAWDSQYNNMSFYIKDENGNRLLVFRTGTLVEIGDQVTVTGTTTLYNEVVQIAQGGVTVIDVKHVCSDFNAADCLNAATCKVCGKVNGEAAGHNYVDGTCSACGATQVAGETVTASKTMKELITELGWTSSTTKQSFNLDDNVSVKINGGNNTGKAYNGDHIRIYATDSPAGTITISVAEGYELVSIKVTTQTGTYAFLYVDGTTEDICNDTVSVSGSSVLLNSVKNGSDGKQVRVMAIEVVYAEK